jgi:hypothetical protein
VRIGRDIIIASWGIVGVVALVGQALVRLAPMALEVLRDGELGTFHWAVLVAWVATNAYAEGIVGFHQKFSPRTVDRSLYLGRNPTWLRVVLAPLFCMGFFEASRRTKIVAWSLAGVIVLLVSMVRRLAQPWRGIIDAGVVVGLSVGIVSLVGLFLHAVVTKREPVLQDVP